MSLNTRRHQGPCKPSSCSTFTLHSHWAELPQAKKKSLVFMCAEPLRSCRTLCDPVDCGLQGFFVREGVLQARILEHIGLYSLPYLSRALYFLLPYPPTPLSTWCCWNPCDPSSCTTSTPEPHRGKPKPSRAASETKPQWTTHM